MTSRGIFFEEDDARAVARRLEGDGYDAQVVRERLAGEDDDEGHPWAVLTDAPTFQLELLVDQDPPYPSTCRWHPSGSRSRSRCSVGSRT